MWEKKMVWIVTVWMKEDEDMNWSGASEEFYADTIEEAEEMKERFLSGQDVEEVWISDEMEERELLKVG